MKQQDLSFLGFTTMLVLLCTAPAPAQIIIGEVRPVASKEAPQEEPRPITSTARGKSSTKGQPANITKTSESRRKQSTAKKKPMMVVMKGDQLIQVPAETAEAEESASSEPDAIAKGTLSDKVAQAHSAPTKAAKNAVPQQTSEESEVRVEKSVDLPLESTDHKAVGSDEPTQDKQSLVPQEEPKVPQKASKVATEMTSAQEEKKPATATGGANETTTDTALSQPIDYDIVLLKNGQEFVGRVTRETKSRITVLIRGGEIVLPRRRVKKIIRAERAEVERKAQETIVLGRYEDREEFYFVYYRGRRVGWRQTSVRPQVEGETRGYRFLNRTVYMKKKGGRDMELNVSEFVDSDLRPVSLNTVEESDGFSHLTSGLIEKGHLALREGLGEEQETREILFKDETEFLQPLIRKLADMSHFPEAGESFKVFDSMRSRFVIVDAKRSLRKEIVAGKHQFVTVWKLKQGDRSWEVWVDGYGGIVREELRGPHMVALRAKPELVLAYARGEAGDGDQPDLTLQYENVPDKFRLARPNLTWSFEFPEFDSPVAITLLNPTLQASADVIVLDHVDRGTAPETLALNLMARMNTKSRGHEILFQKSGRLGGIDGLRFESTAERKGTEIRTIGAVTVAHGRAYALLLAAPSFSFEKVRGQLERVLESFEILDAGEAAKQ